MFKIFKSKKNPSEKNPSEKELKSLLGDIKLPSFNVNVMNALRLLRDEHSSMKDIAVQVEIDPWMNVTVLKTVNSAAFGLVSKVGNIHHAVTMLGRSRLESIVLSAAVKESLPQINMPCLSDSQFWSISVLKASIARALAHRLHPATSAESFTGAFLQDMAIPLMITAKKEEYTHVLDKWFSDSTLKLDEIEKDVLGYDHTRIGALMAKKWDLPDHLVNAISGHHSDKEKTNTDPAVRIVSCIRYNDESWKSVLKENCVTEYNMDENLVEELLEQAIKDSEGLKI